MAESNRTPDYFEFLQRRYRFVIIAVAAALATAAIVSLLLPKRYTATATLLIDPPSTGDPRISTAISPAYLESLKSFEQLASSDSLFLQACRRFNLLSRENVSSVERFKARVLTVEKLKDTRLLRVSVTLRDSQLAQAVAQYLADQTAQLNRSLAQDGDRRLAEDLAQQTAVTKSKVDSARDAAAGLTGLQTHLEEETLALRELKARTQQQALAASAEAAEFSAEEKALTDDAAGNSAELGYVRQKSAGARARETTLRAELQDVERQLAAKEAEWAASFSRYERAQSEVATAEAAFNEIQRRANDLASGAGLRSEQLHIVDPGIVPQRPSFPDIPLILAAAFALSLTGALVFLTLQYRLSQASRHPVRTDFRVARGGR